MLFYSWQLSGASNSDPVEEAARGADSGEEPNLTGMLYHRGVISDYMNWCYFNGIN